MGFFWISRIRCGFKFGISISIKRKIVSEDCPKCFPCCGVSVPSFSHWIFACKELENYRNDSLPFLDDFFLKFALIIEQKSLDVSFDSEKDYDNNIYYFILSALLGGAFNIFKIIISELAGGVHTYIKAPHTRDFFVRKRQKLGHTWSIIFEVLAILVSNLYPFRALNSQ